MKQVFKNRTFRPRSLELLDLINDILDDYAEQGYTLTLHQTFYQLVAKGHIPNTVESYKQIGDLISEGRLCGIIDWERIEDRARETVEHVHWSSPADIVEAAANQFRVDHWDPRYQPVHLEVLVEKQAPRGCDPPML